ncbi:exodeoxyribonuclease VII small subunit [Candidatus Saccharibacteria bacterium]|jgi:exonuclease VII small subunit|nr:exodeoxyribonuclease VII small subunit [Candidatus Saccharibacteria bacterium]
MSNKDESDIKQKISQLSEMVTWFEGDSFQLEQASDKFQAAQLLAQEIETELSKIGNQINVIKQDFSKQ